MQDWHLYEYAVIRIVPRVEREEFMNAGILLYCKQKNMLICKTHLDAARLQALYTHVDLDLISAHLKGFERITSGDKACRSPIAKLGKAERFRWLSATRSTIVQCSPIHPGYALDVEAAAERLLQQLVR